MTLFMAEKVSTIPCAKCGGPVTEFTIPNDIWNKVIRLDGHEHDKEYLCLNCWYEALRVSLGLSDAEQRDEAGGGTSSDPQPTPDPLRIR